MKRCKVLIPFHLKATETDHVPGDVIEVSEEQLAKIRKLDLNMVLVLGDVEEPVQDNPVQEDKQEEPVQAAPDKPKKKKTKKQ